VLLVTAGGVTLRSLKVVATSSQRGIDELSTTPQIALVTVEGGSPAIRIADPNAQAVLSSVIVNRSSTNSSGPGVLALGTTSLLDGTFNSNGTDPAIQVDGAQIYVARAYVGGTGVLVRGLATAATATVDSSLFIGGAFVGAFVLAKLLKKLTGRGD
jgi:hypothetical protein